MQNDKSKLTQAETGSLILIAAIIFGAWFRIMPAWLAGFPVNDGGMFYTMILDLKANHYIPPLFTSYNQLEIPFAYPPLGLYIGAATSDLLGVSPIDILRWLPAIIHTICIPALYLLAQEITGDKLTSAIAAFALAFTPHMNAWLSVGGGLTRSLGSVFLILTILFSHRLLVKNDIRAISWTIFFGSLTVLSHTESTVFAVGIPIFIWLVKSRSVKSAMLGAWVALGVFLFAGVWYGLIIQRHGIAPLVSALQTGGQTPWAFVRLINIDIVTEEPFLDLLGVFGLLGMAVLIIKRHYFLPLMLMVIYLIQPRSAHTVGNIPLALATGIFFSEVLLPAVSKLDKDNRARGANILLFFLIPYLLSNALYQGFALSQNHVLEVERSGMQWVRENTSADSRFLVITGEQDAMCDSRSEWFPALTARTSLTTPQGREWLKNGQFIESYNLHAIVQSCIDDDLQCLEKAVNNHLSDFDYIYISIAQSTQNCHLPESPPRATRGIITALENAAGYFIAYHSEGVIIFEAR